MRRRLLLEESNDVPALEPTPDGHIALGVNSMNLKNRLCDVETDRRHSLHGPVLRIRSPTATMAPTCRWSSRPQHHNRTFPCRIARSCCQLVDQSLGLLQVQRIEPSGEPAVDGGEKILGFTVLTLTAPEPGEVGGGAQFPYLRVLSARDRNSAAKACFRLRLSDPRAGT